MERHRTGGMTAIAVLNIIFGGLVILAGVFQLLRTFVLMYELLRLGVFKIPVDDAAFALLISATGIVGLVAGIGIFRLRSWARTLSLVFAGLLIVSCAFSFLMVPIIASLGTYDFASLGAYNLARLFVFSAVYVVIPVFYSPILCGAFYKPAWRAAFAEG